MSSFDWESFLKQWSQEILESIGNDREKLPPKVIESGWLGYPGATENQIAYAEARLGTTLPSSYRAFLKVTNGWRQTTPFISRLWSTAEIRWFSVRHQDWINEFTEKFGHLSPESSNSSSPHPSIPNQEYFVYGDEQDCSKFRVEYLQTALEISDRGDGAIYLLNPQVVLSNGEWEAWFLGDWLPGADRYHSFQEMMQTEHANFLELRETSINWAEPARYEVAESNELPAATNPAPPLTVTPPLSTESSETATQASFVSPANEEWNELASFTIRLQIRQAEGRFEPRTIVRHVETNTVEIQINFDVKES
jgi:hypothetical protein